MQEFSELGKTTSPVASGGDVFPELNPAPEQPDDEFDEVCAEDPAPEEEEREIDPYLVIKGVSKVFRKGAARLDKSKPGIVALDGVSLEVGKGEIFGLLGPNGAGKSTLIKVVTGLVIPDGGSVTLGGLDFKANKEAFMSKVGAQIETPVFFNKRSGWWNLKYLADLQGGLPDQRIKDIVEIVGLTERINSRVGTYSMGMRQRLGLAQAIMNKPELLVLDEPINGLDPDGIAQVRDLIRRLRDDYGTTVLFSSHILNEMQTLCDRVAFISKGKLVAVKTKKQIARGLGETTVLTVVCDDPKRAASLITSAYGFRTKVQGERLFVEVRNYNVAKINRKLVENGIEVESFTVKSRTLEEMYRELTR